MRPLRRSIGARAPRRPVAAAVPGALCALFLAAAPVGALGAEDAAGLVAETWARYRSVETEREETDILVVAAPPAAWFSRQAGEELLRKAGAAVVHKRAVRHTRYAPDQEDRVHILFSLPAEDAGLGFLIWRHPGRVEDETWLYMPGYAAVRRVPLGNRQKVAGMNLTYEDVRSLAGERTERFTYTSLGRDALDGATCEVIRATPRDGTTSAYSSRKLWIDSQSPFLLKAEFYDARGALWKVLHNVDVSEVRPGVRRASLTEMRDVQQNETTLLLIARRAVGEDIPAAVFTQDYLVHPGAD